MKQNNIKKIIFGILIGVILIIVGFLLTKNINTTKNNTISTNSNSSNEKVRYYRAEYEYVSGSNKVNEIELKPDGTATYYIAEVQKENNYQLDSNTNLPVYIGTYKETKKEITLSLDLKMNNQEKCQEDTAGKYECKKEIILTKDNDNNFTSNIEKNIPIIFNEVKKENLKIIK